MSSFPPPPPARPTAPALPPPQPEPREKRIQNQILRTFGQRRDLVLWRANVGTVTIAGRTVQFGLKGQADLSGIIGVVPTPLALQPYGYPQQYPGRAVAGVRLEIEVKSAKGRQRPEQKSFQQMIERCGGIYILARSVDDVHAALERLIDGYQR